MTATTVMIVTTAMTVTAARTAPTEMIARVCGCDPISQIDTELTSSGTTERLDSPRQAHDDLDVAE